MHSLNLYDYSAMYYESAIGRFTSVDPLTEKKPWLSPYIYCSNNPINRIDPDGRDNTYNMQGRRIEQTPSGSNIKVRIGGTDILLSDLNMASQKHRDAIAGLLSYYIKDSGISVYAKGMMAIGDNPIGTAGLSEYGGNTAVAAYARDKDIWLNTDGNKILNDKYNLINTLVYEAEHKSQNTDPSKSGLKGPIREINAIQAQMEHPSYSKTTKAYQGSTIGYIIKQINSLSMRDEAVTTIVNKANSLNKNYRIDFERSGAGSYTLKVVEINEQKKK